MKEIDEMNRHLTVVDDQNIELEKELDRFLVSDGDIRAKLADRNRSPLRMEDLHLKHSVPIRRVGPPPGQPPIVEPHSRVEVVEYSPNPESRGGRPLNDTHPRFADPQDYRGTQTSPMGHRKLNNQEQDPANHLRNQTA